MVAAEHELEGHALLMAMATRHAAITEPGRAAVGALHVDTSREGAGRRQWGSSAQPFSHQVLSQAENGQAKPGQAKPLSIQRPPPLHLPTIRGPSLDYGQPSPAEMNKAAQEML